MNSNSTQTWHIAAAICRRPEYVKSLLMIALLCGSMAALSCADQSEDPGGVKDPTVNRVHITLYDSDYAQSMSRVYEVDTDRVEVRAVGNLVNEVPELLFDRKLTDEERHLIEEFFNSFPLDELQSTYITPYVQDGDQKLFVISLGALRRRVKVSNYYQKDLASIVNLINRLVPSELSITYANDSTAVAAP